MSKPRTDKELCLGCHSARQAPSSPLCPKCWTTRVSFEARSDFVHAETLSAHRRQVGQLSQAREVLVWEARLAYRLEHLRKLWRSKWRKKFKAKFGLEHQMDREAAAAEPDPDADPTALDNPAALEFL